MVSGRGQHFRVAYWQGGLDGLTGWGREVGGGGGGRVHIK